MMSHSIDQKILERQYALENAMSHPGIQRKLNRVSYDRKTLLTGKALNEKVRLLQIAKKDHYGSQATATDMLAANQAEAQRMYHEQVALARLAFKNDRGMQMKLEIVGPRKRSKDGWLAQAMTFYGKTDEMATAMAGYGVSQETLQQTKAMVEALATTRQQQLRSISEAQDATEQRDIALRAMNAWMRDFRAAARVALKDNPQWLEMLGMPVRSRVK